MNFSGKSDLPVRQNTEDLQEEAIIQEKIHEKEVKNIKIKIELLKKQIKDSNKIFLERIQDLQNKHLAIIHSEKEASQIILNKLQEDLYFAAEDHSKTLDESKNILAKSNEIKERFCEELETLSFQKIQLLRTMDDINKELNQVGSEKIKRIKKLKKLKFEKNFEPDEIKNKIEKERKEVLALLSQKSWQVGSLQVRVSRLKEELAQVKACSYTKIADIKSRISVTRLERKEFKFKACQFKLGQDKRSCFDGQAGDKMKVLESLNEANKELLERYEKLNKLIF